MIKTELNQRFLLYIVSNPSNLLMLVWKYYDIIYLAENMI